MRTAARGVIVPALFLCWLGAALSGSQAAPQEQPQTVDTVFKNVQVLKGLPVDEFMDTMGMFAAALAKDCTGCHSQEILDGRQEAFAIQTPMIQRARQMIVMVNTINRNYFGGQKRVTCATCHIGAAAPENVPNLGLQYGSPLENPSSMAFFTAPGTNDGQAAQIFARYIAALGGAQRLAAATSFVATGTYAGWDTGFQEVPLEIVGRAPDQLTTIARRREGNSVWTFDGRNAWYFAVNSAVPFTLTLSGGNLAGARLEALVALAPARLQEAFGRWQVTKSVIDDQPVLMLRGTNPGEPPVNFYFDASGLLVRMLRWNDTTVGAVPTQYDFSDYREVGGVRRPFQWVKTSTANQVTFIVKEIRPNVGIEAARFAKPVATRAR
jgi:hypothetical protein